MLPVLPRAFSWVMRDIRKIKIFPVRGKLGLYDVSIPSSIDDSEAGVVNGFVFRSRYFGRELRPRITQTKYSLRFRIHLALPSVRDNPVLHVFPHRDPILTTSV
jgi:hypothetical protein